VDSYWRYRHFFGLLFTKDGVILATYRTSEFYLANAMSLGASFTSDIIDVGNGNLISIEYKVPTDTHVGTLFLVAGNIPDPLTLLSRFFTNAGATGVGSGSVALSSGAAANNSMLASSNERYWALVYVRSSGTGTISAKLVVKGRNT
jgi:hypothetical protein